MRLNQFLARHTTLSRRGADREIQNGNVRVNGVTAEVGTVVDQNDKVELHGKEVTPHKSVTILFNKPVGYVCSRDGQGNNTIYDILPAKYHGLNSAGRLDKDSSGLLVLTNDGELAQQLTHPKYRKVKKYNISLDKPLEPMHQQMINDHGVILEDGNSQFILIKLNDNPKQFEVVMREGRNRQIRRTFKALGYQVKKLHRTQFGNFALNGMAKAEVKEINN